MAQRECGKRVWFFPDGDLPPAGGVPLEGHESLIILNPNGRDASVILTVYFEDREPVQPVSQQVPARRVRCIRMDKPIGDFRMPYGQYALKLESTVPVVCQIGRADTRQSNLAYYTVMGFAG
ncbi:MAG TPA: sensory rhodopsin transducer [Bryobacteraceae bacterium]|nr:sensory rhodopsin transducer [Bryobacteraceae bacterium]